MHQLLSTCTSRKRLFVGFVTRSFKSDYCCKCNVSDLIYIQLPIPVWFLISDNCYSSRFIKNKHCDVCAWDRHRSYCTSQKFAYNGPWRQKFDGSYAIIQQNTKNVIRLQEWTCWSSILLVKGSYPHLKEPLLSAFHLATFHILFVMN